MKLKVELLLIICGAAMVGCASPTLKAPDSPTKPAAVTTETPIAIAQQCDIMPAVDWMRDQTIIYTQSPGDEWRDCSGNFLRLSSRIATLCPNVDLAAPPGITRYVHGGNNKRPALAEARTTRGLAKWYDDKGLFVPVYYDGVHPDSAPASLVAFRNNIQPGTVLWFSPQVPLTAQGRRNLYKETGGIINHMGTVVSVRKDDSGNVVGWDMYHGQNARKHNGVTSHLWAKSGRSKPIPQGGYGQQRIVGYAKHLIPK